MQPRARQEKGESLPALPDGWSITLDLVPDASGELGGVAELSEDGVLRCRMVLTRYGTDRASAIARVNARVDYWLSEWLSRPHSGTTSFGELE